MTDQPTSTSGPYVQAASFCRSAIEGKDGTLSIIQMLDRITINAPIDAPEQVAAGQHQALTLVVALKSYEARGRWPLQIVANRPDGSQMKQESVDVIFEGDERGVNIVANVLVEVIEGLYWFDIILAGNKLLTRVPLRFSYLRTPGARVG